MLVFELQSGDLYKLQMIELRLVHDARGTT